jgi:hypothetical protein
MYRIADESYVCSKAPLISIQPTDGCVPPMLQLAKAADVVLYPIGPDRIFLLECPADDSDRDALLELAKEAGLTANIFVKK